MSSNYPPEWPEVSLATKIEAGFRCVRCGHPNGVWSEPGNDHGIEALDLHERLGLHLCGYNLPRVYEVEGGGAWLRHHAIPCDRLCTHNPAIDDHRILTVHHLDGAKENLAWWNLMAACQRCHLEVQGRVKMEQAYLHPHSRWFRPYVAGFYAKTVLGLDLSREEVEDRMAELLIAGQPHLEDFYTQELAA